MWDLIGLGFDLAKAGREVKALNKAFGEFEAKYPQDFPIFRMLYGLFGVHGLKQFILPEEAAGDDRMALATPTRGVADKPFRCVAIVVPDAKEVMIHYYSPDVIPNNSLNRAMELANTINVGSASGRVRLSQVDENSGGASGWRMIYDASLKYRDADDPSRKILDNLLKGAFFAADIYAPAFSDIPRGRPVEQVMGKVQAGWRQLSPANNKGRSTLIQILEDVFRQKNITYQNTPQGNGYWLKHPEWTHPEWRYLLWISPADQVVFEVHFTPNIPADYLSNTLFYSYMLGQGVHVNTRSGIAFIKGSLNVQGCEHELPLGLVNNLIDDVEQEASLYLPGIKYVIQGMEPPAAFRRAVEDDLGGEAGQNLTPETRQLAKSVAEFYTGYQFVEEEEEQVKEEREKSAPAEQSGQPAAYREEPEPGVSMAVPDKIDLPLESMPELDLNLRREYQAFVEAVQQRTQQEEKFAQQYQAELRSIQQEADQQLKSAGAAVDKIGQLKVYALQKVQRMPDRLTLPAETAVDLPQSGAPLRELGTLAAQAEEASRNLDKAINALARYRDRKRIEMLARVAVMAGSAVLTLGFLIWATFQGFSKALLVLDWMRALLGSWGVTQPLLLTWLPVLILAPLVGIAVFAALSAAGAILGWRGRFFGRIRLVYDGARQLAQRRAARPALPDPQKRVPVFESVVAEDVHAPEVQNEPPPANGSGAPVVQFCIECGSKLSAQEVKCPNCGASRYQVESENI